MTSPMDVLNPVDIETAIRSCSNRIAASVRECSGRYNAFLEADRALDQAFAHAYLNADGPAHERKYAAELATAAEREVAGPGGCRVQVRGPAREGDRA
jgi:hypothetical protein